MDGESFDRFSVVVHRLRDSSTRRGALGLLLGGSLAAVGTLLGEESSAKRRNKKNKKNCRGFGGRCSRNSDCCYSKCRNGICWYGGNGGGGGGRKKCGGRKCPAGWDCCKTGGVSVCVPDTYPTCCGGNSYLPGYKCCGGYGGACPFDGECCGAFNQCCQSGWKCCNRGGTHTCIPKNWDCDYFYRQEAGDLGIESAERVPSSAPYTVDDAHWISVAAE